MNEDDLVKKIEDLECKVSKVFELTQNNPNKKVYDYLFIHYLELMSDAIYNYDNLILNKKELNNLKKYDKLFDEFFPRDEGGFFDVIKQLRGKDEC